MIAPHIDLAQNSPVFGWQKSGKQIVLRCPRGHIAYLDHEINEKGEVSPSVQCPKCDFHESGLILEEWTP